MNFNKGTIINIICVIIGLVAAYFVFQNLHPENWMNKYDDVITVQDTKDMLTEEFVGHPAGDDIPRISGKDEFEELYSADYVTIEPTGIVETGLVGLKPWADPYKSSRRGGKKLRDKVMEAGWDYEGVYIPYYLLECPDGTYILAQLPDSYVKAIKKGESVTLPVGYKKSGAVSYKSLKKICEKYGASEEVFYCFDEPWYEEHDMMIFIIRIAAAVITLFALGTVLIIVCEKVFHIKSEE